MKTIKFLIVFVLVLSACTPPKYPDLKEGLYADVQTNIGDVVIGLHYKRTAMTVANFVALAEGNHPSLLEETDEINFYKGVKFHRVIKDFMIQSAKLNPTNKKYQPFFFSDELYPDLKHDKAGVLSMANLGKPYSNSTQFFITNSAAPWLDGYTKEGDKKPCGKYGTACHTVFGKVILGQNIVDSIQVNDFIKKIDIIRVGEAAEDFDAPEVFSKISEETIPFAIKNGIQGLQPTSSGLKILQLKKGTGTKVHQALPVMAHYTLHTIEGVKIQSSLDKGKPIVFTIDKDALIAGWKEGVLQMHEGDKSRLFIPSYLGYGSIGQVPLIQPNIDLVLDIEILKVGK